MGIESDENEEVPYPQEVLIDDIRMVACGYEHSLFLDKNGDLFGCGSNDKKQLLYSNEEKNIKEPTLIHTPDRVKKIFASNFSALITEKDDLFIWGGFLGEIVEMLNPFEMEEFQEENSQ